MQQKFKKNSVLDSVLAANSITGLKQIQKNVDRQMFTDDYISGIIEERKEEQFAATATQFFVAEEGKVSRERVMRESLTNFRQRKTPEPATSNWMTVDYNKDTPIGELIAAVDGRAQDNATKFSVPSTVIKPWLTIDENEEDVL